MDKSSLNNNRKRNRLNKIILTGSVDRDQRKLALDDLDSIANGTDPAAADEARELLDRHQPRPRTLIDPESQEFLLRWREVVDLFDPKLGDFLKELKQKSPLANRIRDDVINDLRKWISRALLRPRPELHPKEIKLLNRFVALIDDMDVYMVELEQLSLLRGLLFQIRYDEIAGKINNALKTWRINEAWSLSEQLDDPPSEFRNEVDELHKRIFDTAAVLRNSEALLQHKPGLTPATWTAVGQLIEHIQRLSAFRNEEKIPPLVLSRITSDYEEGVRAIEEFFKTRAAAMATFKGAREFFAELNSIATPIDDTRLIPVKEWFRTFLDRTVANTKSRLKKARNHEEVQVIHDELKKERLDLPPTVTEIMDELMTDLGNVQANWVKMRSGDDFEIVKPALLVLPTVFRKEAKCFNGYLSDIKDGLSKLQTESGQEREPLYQSVLTIAEKVLNKQPAHALAQTLKERVQRKILTQRIEAALAQWQLSELFALCKQNETKPECGYFIKNEDVIRDWLYPVVTQDEFFDWGRAQIWWANFRSAEKLLSKPVARELEKALQREEDRRQIQWHRLLEKLLAQDLPDSESEAIAASLQEELELSHLESYQKRFKQKAAIERTHRHIDAGQWQQAKKIINGLTEDSNVQKLKLRFEVEQARHSDPAALAGILKNKWQMIAKCYSSSIYELLLEALDKAWEQDVGDALATLRIATAKVLATDENIPVNYKKEIQSWDRWFTIEQELVRPESTTPFRELLAYNRQYKDLGPKLQSRIERLVSRWQEQDNLVLLIWAANEFEGIYFAEDPVERLQRESINLAAGIDVKLRKRTDLATADIAEMDRDLRAKADQWRKLDEYLDLLSKADRPSMPEDLQNTKKQVGILLTVLSELDELRAIDLRDEHSRLESVDFRLRKNLKEDVALREPLMAEVARLEPLTTLKSLQNQINNAIRRCRRREDLSDVGVFLNVAELIQKLITELAPARSLPMWKIVSDEYCRKVYEIGCISGTHPPDLESLVNNLQRQEAKDVRFRKTVDRLWEDKPIVSSRTIQPEKYEAYYKLFPTASPTSWREYAYFEAYAANENVRLILEQSGDRLPSWVRTYLVDGIPPCIDES